MFSGRLTLLIHSFPNFLQPGEACANKADIVHLELLGDFAERCGAGVVHIAMEPASKMTQVTGTQPLYDPLDAFDKVGAVSPQ